MDENDTNDADDANAMDEHGYGNGRQTLKRLKRMGNAL